jgi:hypothetical protein
MKRTPLAETFTVAAANSSASVERTTGSLKGNRTAQRTSFRSALWIRTGETGNSVVDGFMQDKSFLKALSSHYLNSRYSKACAINTKVSFTYPKCTLNAYPREIPLMGYL